jgi:hypothetical protein
VEIIGKWLKNLNSTVGQLACGGSEERTKTSQALMELVLIPTI